MKNTFLHAALLFGGILALSCSETDDHVLNNNINGIDSLGNPIDSVATDTIVIPADSIPADTIPTDTIVIDSVAIDTMIVQRNVRY